MAELFARDADGSLKLHIHAELPFTVEGVRQAQDMIERGASAGKMLIKVA